MTWGRSLTRPAALGPQGTQGHGGGRWPVQRAAPSFVALKIWCEAVKSISVRFLESFCSYLDDQKLLVVDENKQYQEPLSNVRKTIELLLSYVDMSVYNAAPVSLLENIFHDLNINVGGAIEPSELGHEYKLLSDAVAKCKEIFKNFRNESEIASFNIYHNYIVNLANLPKEFGKYYKSLLLLGDDGYISTVTLMIASALYQSKEAFLAVLSQISEHQIDVYANSSIFTLLSQLALYKFSEYLHETEFCNSLVQQCKTLPGVLANVMLAFVHMREANIFYSIEGHDPYICTASTIALGATDIKSVPPHCQMQTFTPNHSVSSSILAYQKSIDNNAELYIVEFGKTLYCPAVGSTQKLIQLPVITPVEKTPAVPLPKNQPPDLLQDFDETETSLDNQDFDSKQKHSSHGDDTHTDFNSLKNQTRNIKKSERLEQPIGTPTGQSSYAPKILLAAIVALTLCAGAALAFKLVKRKPEPDVEAPPVENSDGTPNESSEDAPATPKTEENTPHDSEQSKQ